MADVGQSRGVFAVGLLEGRSRLCDIAEALGVTITERTELRDPNAA